MIPTINGKIFIVKPLISCAVLLKPYHLNKLAISVIIYQDQN